MDGAQRPRVWQFTVFRVGSGWDNPLLDKAPEIPPTQKR